MKNVKPVEVACMLLLVLGFMLFCLAIPSMLLNPIGIPEDSYLLRFFEILSALGLVFGSVLVILLPCAMYKISKAKKSEKKD